MRTHRGRDRGYELLAPSKAPKRERILAALAMVGEGEYRWASEIARAIGLQPSGDQVGVALRELEREGLVVRMPARGRDLWRLATPVSGGAA